jgi:hypothetical protein
MSDNHIQVGNHLYYLENGSLRRYPKEVEDQIFAERKAKNQKSDDAKNIAIQAMDYLSKLDQSTIDKIDKKLSLRIQGSARDKAERTKLFRFRLKQMGQGSTLDAMINRYMEDKVSGFDNFIDRLEQKPLTSALAFGAWATTAYGTYTGISTALGAEATAVAGTAGTAGVASGGTLIALMLFVSFVYGSYKGLQKFNETPTTTDKYNSGTSDDTDPTINFEDLIPQDVKEAYSELNDITQGFLDYIWSSEDVGISDEYLTRYSEYVQTGFTSPTGYIDNPREYTNTERDFGYNPIIQTNSNTETGFGSNPIIKIKGSHLKDRKSVV